jgi:hypothetical protein
MPNNKTSKLQKESKDKTLQGSVKSIFQIILTCLAVLVLFYFLQKDISYYEGQKKQKLLAHSDVAIGLIIKTGSMKGSYAVVEYFVDEKRYEKTEASPADDIKRGQRFEVKYSVDDPHDASILFEKPLFDKSDKTDTVRGTVVQIDENTFRFAYVIGGVEYKKFQKKSTEFNAELKQTYIVRYLVNNPEIAALVNK